MFRCSARRLISSSPTSTLQYRSSKSFAKGVGSREASSSSSALSSSITTAKEYRVGFIGLGNMGLPMALNLANNTNHINGDGSENHNNSNVSVVVFDTNEAACEIAECQGNGGVTLADSVSEIVGSLHNGSNVDAIFTMLPDSGAVDAVMDQIMYGVAFQKNLPKICVVDCSTVSPTTSRKWHDIWAERGHAMFDAPVSGGVKGAAAGALTFMVGCGNSEAASMEHVVRPLLQRMGPNIFVCGGPGAGSATKLCNNLALAAQMVGICEAMNLGEGLGVDPIVLAQVMNVSTAACWSSKVNNPHPAVATAVMKAIPATDGEEVVGPPASRGYQGGFGAKLMLKDLTLAVAAAEECGVMLPLTSTTKELYLSATAKGLGDKDFGVMLEYLKTYNE